MNDYRRTARTIGVLFIVASVTAVIGGSLVALPLKEPDYLTGLAAQDTAVITGVVLLMVQAVAVIGIAALFFPVIRRSSEGMALGLIGARTIEAVLVVASAVAALAVLTLSRDQGQAADPGAPVDPGVQALGDTLVAAYDWIYLLGPMLFFSISALILYPLLYRARLVPSWLSLWGLIGGALLLVLTLLELYGVGVGAVVQGILTAPIGLNEMVLAVWLIVKGFNPVPRFAPDDRNGPALG